MSWARSYEIEAVAWNDLHVLCVNKLSTIASMGKVIQRVINKLLQDRERIAHNRRHAVVSRIDRDVVN